MYISHYKLADKYYICLMGYSTLAAEFIVEGKDYLKSSKLQVNQHKIHIIEVVIHLI